MAVPDRALHRECRLRAPVWMVWEVAELGVGAVGEGVFGHRTSFSDRFISESRLNSRKCCKPSSSRSLYAPVLWAGSALPIELNLIITIDADLPTPQTPPSPPILMRGGMERPVWCFHPQGLG